MLKSKIEIQPAQYCLKEIPTQQQTKTQSKDQASKTQSKDKNENQSQTQAPRYALKIAKEQTEKIVMLYEPDMLNNRLLDLTYCAEKQDQHSKLSNDLSHKLRKEVNLETALSNPTLLQKEATQKYNEYLESLALSSVKNPTYNVPETIPQKAN